MSYPLELFSGWITYSVLGIAPQTLLANAVSFFIADIIKIFILLFVIISAVSVVRTYLNPKKVYSFLAKKNRLVGHISAALVGIVTPFCSCSAVPLFLGFVEAGVPLGITFSFLVASPMINEVALVLIFGLFGWKIALTYILSGLAIAVVSGVVIGRLKTEHLLTEIASKNSKRDDIKASSVSFRDRLSYATGYAISIIKKVWLYVVIGVGLGAWIHGYIPADFLVQYAGSDKWYAVPLATLIGIPLYSNAAGVIPLVSALTEKGMAMGTTLAFMMSVTALSLPEFMILKKVMKAKLILIFASVVGIGIMVTGYLFNLILE